MSYLTRRLLSNELTRLTKGVSPALAAVLREAAMTGLAFNHQTGEYWLRGVRAKQFAALPGATVTRASTGFNNTSSGELVSFAANTLRRTDGVGALTEPAATNLLLHSQNLSGASWSLQTTGTASTPIVTPNFASAPDGTLTASRLECALNGGTSGGDQSRVQCSPTVPLDAQYAFSFYARLNSGSTGRLNLQVNTNIPSQSVELTSNWQRFVFTGTATGTAVGVFIGSRGGSGSSDSIDALIWGAQLETGPLATSYIPTTTASATRAADTVNITGLTFSGAHTIIAFTGPNSDRGSDAPYQLDDGTSSNRTTLYSAAGQSRPFVVSGGATQADVGNGAGTWATAGFRAATRVATNDIRGAVNGVLGTADTVATVPAGTLSRFNIGSGGGFFQFTGLHRIHAILPRALTDAQLQAVTA